jgi:hypothetical protein
VTLFTFLLDRKISLIGGRFRENDGRPNSAEDGLSVILAPFYLLIMRIIFRFQ